jgi:hypothetical protein
MIWQTTNLYFHMMCNIMVQVVLVYDTFGPYYQIVVLFFFPNRPYVYRIHEKNANGVRSLQAELREFF